jgi:hypothetical protein
MNWKIFTIVCIDLFAICFPYNILGCAGGEEDPYDYFVSFYHRDLGDEPGYEPFYYTNYRFLYDSEEPVNTAGLTSSEWVGYAGNKFDKKAAYAFVCEFALKDISNLYYNIEKNQPLNVPDSVSNNDMSRYFTASKDLEALGYLIFAKKAEPHVTGSWTSWEPITRDTVAMGKLMKNGRQLYGAAKNDFIKLRYAYQIMRLAHYSQRYKECIQVYNELVQPNSVNSVLKDLSISLYAGAMLKQGENLKAAYKFSKLFSKSSVKRVSNYMSFDWCVKRLDEKQRQQCLALGKTNEEKANILALFILGSNQNEFNALRTIYTLNPMSKVLELLTLREIHKLEENYFTPSLNDSKSTPENTAEVAQLVQFCKELASGNSTNKAFYSLTAAHAAMMMKDYSAATELLEATKKMPLNQKLKDQLTMTSLLVTINSKPALDAAFEEQLMSSVQWLEKKAALDPEYAKFFRRLFADILYNKYRKMTSGQQIKYMLCSGVADHIQEKFVKDSWGYYSNSLYKLRTEMKAEQVEQLVALMESKKLNRFEKYLVEKSAFKKDDVNDVAGTTWLRQFNFAAAEKWFRKVPAAYYKGEPFSTYMAANPFADLILDTHAPTKQDTVRYTKLSFTEKMIRLEKQLVSVTDKEAKAKIYYEMAKGFYHMSYWGNSWMLVEYGWSTYISDEEKTARAKDEYYSVAKAEDYYLKAAELSTDRNLRAKSVFMAAKCDQKQFEKNIPVEFSYETPQKYRTALREWTTDFNKRNGYYDKLVKDYGSTAFYKEAFSTCSYLKDFATRKK